jgi:sulfatase modifying factor 1
MARLVVAACSIAGFAACAATPNGERECAYCPEMVTVPAGTAILGAAAGDRFRNVDELPERRIDVAAPFAVGRYEVTRAQYQAFVQATGRAVGGDCLTDRVKRGTWVVDAGTNFRDPGFPQTDADPVACVNWEEAQAYVDWLNTRTSGGYRLLTEVEWEYVARAGATRNTVYPWGDDPGGGCPFANGFDRTAMATYAGADTSGHKVFDPLLCADGWLNTAPVGSLAPNALGVHDMIGNVGEWVGDCYRAAREEGAASGPPTAAADICARRLAKGGSWGTLAHNLRTAERLPYAATHRDDSIGFRVAKTLGPE